MDNQIKQQADELVEKFMNHSKVDDRYSQELSATHCAIIAVEKIIKSSPHRPITDSSNCFCSDHAGMQALEFWEKVLEELKSRI